MSSPKLLATKPRRAPGAVLAQLGGLMFLQFWSFGAWVVTVGTYIAANTGEEGRAIFSAGFIGYSSAAAAIGSTVSPAIVGYLSDRFFSARALFSVMHLGCAFAAWGMHASQTQLEFLMCLLAYFHCFFPGMALANKIAMSRLAHTDAEYPLIRIAGTVGWISSGLCVGYAVPTVLGYSIEPTSLPLMLGAGGSLTTAVYALTLPNAPLETPEGLPATPQRFPLLRNQPLVMFLVVCVIACMTSVAYNSYANVFLNLVGFQHPAALMTLGQVSDLACLAVTPGLIALAGLRSAVGIGILAWIIRYLLLAIGSHGDASWPIYAAIAIHGPCFVFVFVAGAMLVDQLAPAAQRGTAQGLFAVASTGVGSLLGALAMGRAQTEFLTPEGVSPPPYDWPAFWMTPALIGVIAAVAYLAIFPQLAPAAQSRAVEAKH